MLKNVKETIHRLVAFRRMRSVRHKINTKPSLELLEPRDLLACTVCTFSESSGRLHVDTPTGSNDDSVAIGAMLEGGAFFVAVTYAPEGAAATTERVETSPGSGVFVRSGDVRGIDVETHSGKDIIDLRGVTTASGYLGRFLDNNIDLKGQEKKDTIYGSPFADILDGGDRDDRLEGGAGDDIYRFMPVSGNHGLGTDEILDTGGTDTLDYSAIDFPIDVDLNMIGVSQAVGPDHKLKLLSETIENVYASASFPFDDRLIGNTLDNHLQGYAGSDYLVGGDGDDTLDGGDGPDHLNGGPGADTVYGGPGNDIVEGDGFGSRIEGRALQSPNPNAPGFDPLDEASGLVVGRTNPAVLWTIEDHGNPAYLYANTTDGTSRGFYNVTNVSQSGPAATNTDWEDLAFYTDNGTNYLYIADIGDGTDSRSDVVIYRVEEPAVRGGTNGFRGNLTFDVIRLVYPNDSYGGRNAETFMIDPLSGDFYIVSKSEPGRSMAHLYRTGKPADTDWTANPQVAVTRVLRDEGPTEFLANTRSNSPSGGDVSADGSMVIVRSDAALRLYRYDRHSAVRSIPSLLMRNEPLQIFREPQKENREAVAFHPNGLELYTVAEAPLDPDTGQSEPRNVNQYDRVDDLLGASNENRDILYGGTPVNPSGSVDFYIGVLDTTAANRNEVADFRGNGVNDVDLVLDVIGDMNFDGTVNGLDVDPFMTAVLSSEQYLGTWGLGGYVHGDVNADGEVNGLDVDRFVTTVVGGGLQSISVEPGTTSEASNAKNAMAKGSISSSLETDQLPQRDRPLARSRWWRHERPRLI